MKTFCLIFSDMSIMYFYRTYAVRACFLFEHVSIATNHYYGTLLKWWFLTIHDEINFDHISAVYIQYTRYTAQHRQSPHSTVAYPRPTCHFPHASRRRLYITAWVVGILSWGFPLTFWGPAMNLGKGQTRHYHVPFSGTKLRVLIGGLT